MAMPLHIGYVRLLDDDEKNFIKVLLENYQYIGWYMFLRFGSIKTTKKVLSRKECIEKAEKEIKNIIRIRIACASLCYQLYRYEQRKAIPHSSAVLNWKDICRGKKSEKEFVEVKRCWLE